MDALLGGRIAKHVDDEYDGGAAGGLGGAGADGGGEDRGGSCGQTVVGQ
jgi:hypothetical protein